MRVEISTDKKEVVIRYLGKEVRVVLRKGVFHVESFPSGNALIE